MEINKKSRTVCRAAFTKNANELEVFLSAEEKSVNSVKVSWQIVQQKFASIEIVDAKIYSALLEADAEEEVLTAEMDGCDNYFKKYTEMKLKVEEFLMENENDTYSQSPSHHSEHQDDHASQRSVASSLEGQGKRKFKLPTIEFKKFSGDVREWLGFWAQFKKIHDDPEIDLHDKIVYLVQATVEGSKARQLVESFPAMHGNYEKIIDSLKSRFGRDDILIEVYVRELLKLILSNATAQEKPDISTLYDKIESHLRALETLGITKQNCASMLFPLIESCLPEHLLRAWQRSNQYIDGCKTDGNKSELSPLQSRLNGLMAFLRSEVENEQRILLATESFGINMSFSDKKPFNSSKFKPKSAFKSYEERTATATGLVNCDVAKCIFCEGAHDSESCFKAKKFSLDEKREILTKKGACYKCLKLGHMARKCRGRTTCLVCGRSHSTLLCPESFANKREDKGQSSSKDKVRQEDRKPPEQALSCHTNSHVFLQTLKVTAYNGSVFRDLRVLMDTGSQRSYILSSTAKELGYVPTRSVTLGHALFGGKNTTPQFHHCYQIKLKSGNYSCTLEALDQSQICSNVQPICFGDWIEELKMSNIYLSDVGNSGPIEVLLGADVMGKLFTGQRHSLKSGLVAIHTLLGWTIMGKIPSTEMNTSLTTLSMLIKDAPISDLWELDVLGIVDPTEAKNRQELALAAKRMFQETVTLDENGRYEVFLPWTEGHPPLSSNYSVAKKRLDSTVRKLKRDHLLEQYDQVFKDWLQEDIIEEVPLNELNDPAHYLPHRAVVKKNSTTRIRPVFDASSSEKGKPSLNSCLEIGPNFIESIPSMLLRFRMFQYGVISDIKKAFLQISLHQTERNFLRFLWLDSSGKEKTFRHKRVVFGVSSSPFLLGATIEHHLSQCKQRALLTASYTVETVEKLAESFYVDNCVTSLEDEDYVIEFIKQSTTIMNEGRFELRGWEYTTKDEEGKRVEPLCVLGLSWDPTNDDLAICNSSVTDSFEALPITKRHILSIAQKVFDPIGYTCPSTLLPKLLLQRTWKQKLSWDGPVDEEIREEFCNWTKELELLSTIKIPRWIKWGAENHQECSIHLFCDASKDAYAAVIYIRIRNGNEVFVHLLAAKARVTPLKKITIPRLELLAATIGSRLYHSVIENFKHPINSYFWSDSSTVISWIQREEEWSTFIRNRVQEIKSLTSTKSWRHIAGSMNPADLPSRGCSIRQLVKSKWWKGPLWLYQEPETWPIDPLKCDEEEISQERRKTPITAMVNIESIDWHLDRFSKYNKTLRMIAWIFRFAHNARNPVEKHRGTLTTKEIQNAEVFVLKLVQAESFPDLKVKSLRNLNPFRDQLGLIRLKSRISERLDVEDFRYPILLPCKNLLVSNLIFDTHASSCHVGTQGLLCILRERYWILGGRKTLRSIISKCSVCRRQISKHFEENPAVLPLDRVREAAVFEVTGVDFAGPLFLKSGEKAWICLFTCAVYRAVHFELATSLSTSEFIQVLRRFIARRGRPTTIYSDNGTNFVGAENCFSQLNWNDISDFSAAQRITWRFNPPSAPWWGGFWERLVGVLKQLLRRILQRACLSYEELLTVICDCESVVNSRPLTYVSDNPLDLVPLTPSMFLQEIVECGVPECDTVDKASLTRRVVYKQRLREVLRARFRSEYLGQLKQVNKTEPSRAVRLNEVVIIGNDNEKRMNWPLGKVVELVPGKDGKIRLVRVQTARGQLLRPIQRLYPLEVIDGSELQSTTEGGSSTHQPSKGLGESAGVEDETLAVSDSESARVKSRVSVEPKSSRSGRILRKPERFS